jgi:hypothetical protein
MPFALLIVGVFLLVAGVRGTQTQLFTLVHGDFTGSDNFIYWLLAILAIGAVGYIPRLKGVSNAMLALVIVILFLSRGGFFARFTSAIGVTGSEAGVDAQTTSTGIGSPAQQVGLSQLQALEAQNNQAIQNLYQQLQATF